MKKISFKRIVRWEKDFSHLFLHIAVPIAIQNMVAASAHIVDGLMISGLGDSAYAAVSQAGRFSFLFNLFMFGASSGSSIFISQFFGSKNEEGIRKIMSLCLKITLTLAILFMTGALLFTRPIMNIFLAPGESHALGMEYLRYVCLSYLFAAVDVVYSNTLRATGQPKVTMFAGIASILTNTFLNYCLIYGNFGFPELGVKGAAVATAIAAFVSMAINVGYTYLNRHCGALKLHDFIKLPSGAFIRDYFKKVIPVVVNEGLWSLGITTYAIFHGMYSDAAISAIAVYNNLDQLMTVMVFGVVNATSIMIGNAIGEDDREKARLTAFRMLFAIEVLSLFTGTMLITLRNPMLSVYGSISALSAEALEKASVITLIAGCFMPIRFFNSLNIVGVLRAGGDTIFSMVLDAGSVWVFGVPCVAIAATVLHLPIEGVYAASLVEEFFKMAFGLPRFLSGKWIHNLTHIGEPENAK